MYISPEQLVQEKAKTEITSTHEEWHSIVPMAILVITQSLLVGPVWLCLMCPIHRILCSFPPRII